ncbi:hypothetical protein BZL54_11205 [Burkholderia ubonensis subsp. mesacidophila]|uniref:Uncharacterized protein n=1 Tax=Burkholderia ubonensis subsp. mesacidophila TaxID=265293 RepID=A0A2A4FIN2_9BURK|nr:hypothetical protein BZL54_11205 [Burkholderia ubonensis subsp. mesacidophila]
MQNRGGQSTPLDRREGVTNEAGRYAEQQGATYYSAAVQGVSTVLQNNRLGITQQSHDSVLGNLDGIAQGKQTHTGAHMTESLSFGKDAIKHFQNGELRDGVVTAAGSALNAAASLTFGPGRDLQTALQHRDPKVRVDAMASLHQDFAMLSDFTKEHD